MPNNRPIVALLYDFDHTLSCDDMQNFSFIPDLGMTPDEFWNKTSELTEKEGMERILAYMYMMIKLAKEKNVHLTKAYLNSLGKEIKFFEGVTTWFKRINQWGEEMGVDIEHYLISSGTKEIVDGCQIAKEFAAVYGCEFLFDENGEAIWPKIAINYTAKTQFLFRVSKGALDTNDDVTINRRIDKRIPFTNMIYLGDGLTDIPCMVLVKEKGGKSIAIYQKGKKEKVMPLYEEGRVNFVCKADYRSGSNLEKIVKLIIEQVSITDELLKRETELINK